MNKLNLRNFIITSATLLIIALLVIFYFINNVLRLEIQKTAELANATLTRIFVNETWSEINPLLPAPGSTEEEIKNNTKIKQIDTRVRRFMSYTDVLKVKIYSINGMTLYSSDFKQIGENKANNKGFQQALKGQLASELTYRGQFGGFDGELYNRNLVSTYAPIRDGYQVVAVAEIYSDRTALIQQADEVRNQLFLTLFSLFGVIYGLMLFYSHKIYKRLTIKPSLIDQNLPEDNFENLNYQKNQNSYHGSLKNNAFPLPQLSLLGIEKIIQYLFYAKNLNLLSDGSVDSKNFLQDLSNQADTVIEKINKYKNFVSIASSDRHLKNSNFFPSQFIDKITKYSESKRLTNVKIQHNKNLPTIFTQNENLIISIITSFLDLIVNIGKNPDGLIKINFDGIYISINIVINSKISLDQEWTSLFQELDNLLSEVGKRQTFNYKSTLSDKGLLVTLTFDQMLTSESTSNDEIYSEAVIFGDSKLEMNLLRSMLNRLGIGSVNLVESADFNSFTSLTTNKLILILQNSMKNLSDSLNLIDQLKNMGFDAKSIVVITDSNFESQFNNRCVVLPMPFDLVSLSSLVTRAE